MPWGKLKLGAGGGLQKDETVATKAAAPPSIHSKVRHNRLEEVSAAGARAPGGRELPFPCERGGGGLTGVSPGGGQVVALLQNEDVNKKDKHGNTPMHIACQNGRMEVSVQPGGGALTRSGRGDRGR